MENRTYHIIGAGVAGLNAAKRIKLKHPQAKVVIYEAAKQAGGRCYSFYDKTLQTNIDNATHVILGANVEACKFLDGEKFERPFFVDVLSQDVSSNVLKNKEEIALAVFNADIKNVPFKMLCAAAKKLFPFFGKRLKAYYSHNDLSEKLISPLLGFADEIKFGYALKSFEEENDRIVGLEFNKGKVEVDADDVVVSAVDAHNYAKIFGGPEFEFNSIINIFFRTSMKITLPRGLNFLGVKNGISQWIFANKDTISVTISDADGIEMSDEELAVAVWKEICSLRGRQAARLPAYRVIHNKRATIKQDSKNNALRDVKSRWNNFRVIGDWTMKDFPCCIEGAILSAKKISRV